ncbi:SHOCT domain-containing protein [Paramicrobacterium agarici]|uniref:SHOCT domain-containing protein n=1 Tax=Paramicrobacterium agarici TaxID=630514 RepID=UPI0011536E2E|nr:SHOCT domain-containing protein [Microbacterium agarici]TQO24024.1 putative membrane protein [Microbacterium agarici]
MLISPVITSLAAHGPFAGGDGPGWWFLLIPLFWIAVFALLFTFVFRRRRDAMQNWKAQHSPRHTAEKTLAQRYANGDIDEAEYRARLEVLRANTGD